jgi:hypothetical protein
VKETDATALFPGGFGTHDEGFEILTLFQTGKSRPRPIVLMEPPGSSYWASWKRFVMNDLLKNGYIDKDDLKLFTTARSADEAIKYIEDFYRVYHSIKYVSGTTSIRLNKRLSDGMMALINKKFKDILKGGDIKLSGPMREEVRKGEFVELPRLVMKFNMRNYGRLCELIHTINKD